MASDLVALPTELVRSLHRLVDRDERRGDDRTRRRSSVLPAGSCRSSRSTSSLSSSRTQHRRGSAAALRSNTVGDACRSASTARELPDDRSTPVEAAERLLALVAELDTHDRLTRGHSDRVRAYAQMIGEGAAPDRPRARPAELGSAAPRRRQAERPGRDPDQGRAGRPTRSGQFCAGIPSSGSSSSPRSGMARGVVAGRPAAPRALGRQRATRRARRRRDRACCAGSSPSQTSST